MARTHDADQIHTMNDEKFHQLYLYGNKQLEEASLHLDTLRGTGKIIPYMIAVQNINGIEAKHNAILQIIIREEKRMNDSPSYKEMFPEE
jgi:hypothetical protein